MSRSERDKGLRGEQEVARSYLDLGFTVRGLEGGGDHSIVRDPTSGVRLHSEVKRQETARPWAWWAQAEAEAPAGTVPVVHFRRSRSPWLVLLRLADFQALLVGDRRELTDAEARLAAIRQLCLDPSHAARMLTRRELLALVEGREPEPDDQAEGL